MAVWTLTYSTHSSDRGTPSPSSQNTNPAISRSVIIEANPRDIYQVGSTAQYRSYWYDVYFEGNGGTPSTSVKQSKEYAYPVYCYTTWAINGSSYGLGDTCVLSGSATALPSNRESTPSSWADSYFESITLPSATRNGYTFEGWYTSASGGSLIGGAGTSWTPTSDEITLYAHWEANTCTISYNGNGNTSGSPPSSDTVTKGTWYTPKGNTGDLKKKATDTPSYKTIACYSNGTFYTNITNNITKNTTYSFGGWGTEGFWANENKTLYAQWNSEDTYSGYADLPYAPSRTGYTFDGWYTSASGGTRVGGSGDTWSWNGSGNAGITALYAHWSVKTVYIYYEENDGSESGLPATGSGTYGSSYTFSLGSNTKKQSSTRSETSTVTYNANGGMWFDGKDTQTNSGTKTITTTYQLTGWTGTGGSYNLGGSTTLSYEKYTVYPMWNSQETSSGGSVRLYDAPDRSTYAFDGWWTASSGGTKRGDAGDTWTPSGDTTLYAHWKAKTPHTITYTKGGATFGTPPEATTGYAGENWPIASTMGGLGYYSNVVEKATFGYEISFNTDGGSGSIPDVRSYAHVNYGYLYTQWYVYGRNYLPGSYVDYKSDSTATPSLPEKSTSKYIVDHYDTITLPSTTKAGYTFVGWKDPNNNIHPAGLWQPPTGFSGQFTLIAQWVINRTIYYYSNDGTGRDDSEDWPNNSEATIRDCKWTRTNYSFIGWSTDGFNVNPNYPVGGKFTIKGDLWLYAIWKLQEATITYEANDSTEHNLPSSTTAPFGQDFSLDLGKSVTKDNGIIKIVVTYQANGGTWPEGEITKTNEATKTIIYGFAGWRDKETGVIYDPQAEPIYIDKASYIFNPVWGEKSSSTQPVKLYRAPDFSGKRFKGWYTQPKDGERIGGSEEDYTPTDPITLYAQWGPRGTIFHLDSSGGPAYYIYTYVNGKKYYVTTNPPES